MAQSIDEKVVQFLKKKIGRNTRVILWAANSLEWIETCFAVIKCGAIIVPVDVQVDDEAMKHIIKDSEAEFLFTTKDMDERLKKLHPGKVKVIHLDEPTKTKLVAGKTRSRARKAEIEETLEKHLRAPHPDSVAALFYTSGTTGLPKGVPLTHRNLTYQTNTLAKTDIVTDDLIALLPLPLHHIYPFTVGLLTCLGAGATIVFPAAMTGPSLAAAIKESEATLIIGVPRLYSALLAAIERTVDSQKFIAKMIAKKLWKFCSATRRKTGLSLGRILLAPAHKKVGQKLRMLASGGAPLDPEVLSKLEGLGWNVIVGYGLTETSPILTLNQDGSRRSSSAGKPIEGVELKIVPVQDDEDDKPGKKDKSEGEVLARSDGVFSGYVNLEEQTEEAFSVDGWFRTGDLGKIDDDGYLYIKGRISTMFKTAAGEKVQAEDLEDAFEKSPGIKEIGVLMDGEKLVALVVPKRPDRQASVQAGSIESSVKKAIEEGNKKLASHQRITDFVVTNQPLPRTRLSKIRRKELEEQYKECKSKGTKGGGESAKPMEISEMTSEDQALLGNPQANKIWQALTSRYKNVRITPESDLHLDLNIDSLEWVNLSLQLQSEAGIDLNDDDIRDVTAVRDLLELAQKSRKKHSGKVITLEEVFQDPDKALKPNQKKWLQPLEGITIFFAKCLHVFIIFLMRTFFNVSAEGLENIPEDGPLIISPNHASYMDPFALASVLSFEDMLRTNFAGYVGVVFANSFNRFIARLSQSIPIDPFADIVGSIAIGASVLKHGRRLVWFPEGERSKTGELISFKPGVALLSENLDVPILPVYLDGTHEAYPPGKLFPKPTKVTVKFGKPLYPDKVTKGSRDEKKKEEKLVTALRSEIEHLKSA